MTSIAEHLVVTCPWARVTAYWVAAYRRVWVGSAFADFLAPVLFLAGIGFGLGSLVESGAGSPVIGASYAAYVAPGVLAAQAMQTAVSEATYPVLGSVIWNRAYHAMLATPVTTADVVTGHLAYVALRVTAAASVFLAVAAALGAVPLPRLATALLAVPVAVLVGMAFAAPAFALAARARGDQALALVLRFGVLPLFLFSGTFFPLASLPAPLQWLGWATPLWHGVEACRALALGTAEAGGVLAHLVVPAVWLVVGVVLARRALRTRMVS